MCWSVFDHGVKSPEEAQPSKAESPIELAHCKMSRAFFKLRQRQKALSPNGDFICGNEFSTFLLGSIIIVVIVGVVVVFPTTRCHLHSFQLSTNCKKA